MAADKQFGGFDHESLPEPALDFSCKQSESGTQPEAVVDIWHDCQWVRLPITSVETRINKDGPADITYTSEVNCPVTWGQSPDGDEKVPIYEYVGADEKEADNAFDLARVFYWNDYTEEYTVEQFGYVASIGPGEQNGTFRFYIYDAADMMSNVHVTKTYDAPTASSVAEYVAYGEQDGLDETTVIPVLDVTTTAPAEDVKIGLFETFDKAVAGWAEENIPILKGNDDSVGELLGTNVDPFEEGAGEWLDDALRTGGHKHFKRNRHTLLDIMNWLTDEIGGSWYFEPVENGVILVVNNGVEDNFQMARNAYYDGNFNPDELEYIQGYNPAAVDVLNNTSLNDLKPINTLRLNGESAASILGTAISGITESIEQAEIPGPQGAPGGHTDKYPFVKVTYPPLVDRAGGKEMGPTIESDKITLSEAEEAAVKEFKRHHEDNTEGSIEVKSLPSIRPYDYFAAVPVCNDTFDADMSPIQYEVNSVTHRVEATERYTTSLGVSIALDEDILNDNVQSEMKDIAEDTAEQPTDSGGGETTTDDFCKPG